MPTGTGSDRNPDCWCGHLVDANCREPDVHPSFGGLANPAARSRGQMATNGSRGACGGPRLPWPFRKRCQRRAARPSAPEELQPVRWAGSGCTEEVGPQVFSSASVIESFGRRTGGGVHSSLGNSCAPRRGRRRTAACGSRRTTRPAGSPGTVRRRRAPGSLCR
jgi:hypothetical protein